MKHKVTMSLRLENGKFWRGDVEVPPEIGNVEQIALLRKAEKELENIEEHGSNVSTSVEDIRYSLRVQFTCICGHKVEDVDTYRGADDVIEVEDAEWDVGTVVCRKCGREYEIEDGKAKLVK